MFLVSRFCQSTVFVTRTSAHSYKQFYIARNSNIRLDGQAHWRQFRGQGSTSGSGRRSLAPTPKDVTQFEGSRRGKLLLPIVFTAAFSCSCFAGAAIWQYEDVRRKAIKSWKRSFDSFGMRTRNIYNTGEWRYKIHEYWNNLNEGQRLAIAIIGVNVFVFLLWRNPRWQSAMTKYFCANPAAKAVCWPMVLSTFSHYTFWHLGVNMYVLYSLAPSIVNMLGKEQFLALYLSAGVIASLTSHLHKVVLFSSGLSLGASGCLMGAIGYFCYQYPDAKMSIVFLPMFPFSAASALKGMMALDLAGVLFGWRLFDHAAHLGGVCFGIAYAKWGREYVWEKREPFLKWWHQVRGDGSA